MAPFSLPLTLAVIIAMTPLVIPSNGLALPRYPVSKVVQMRTSATTASAQEPASQNTAWTNHTGGLHLRVLPASSPAPKKVTTGSAKKQDAAAQAAKKPKAKKPKKNPKDSCGQPTKPAVRFDLDCKEYPESCENHCYFMHCKPGARDNGIVDFTPDNILRARITIDRSRAELNYKAGGCAFGRSKRCNQLQEPNQTWSRNPKAGMKCAAFPPNVALEGGALSATRCIPAAEMTSLATRFNNFINAEGPARVDDCDQVDIVPIKYGSASVCNSWYYRDVPCPEPAKYNDPGAAQDWARQQ